MVTYFEAGRTHSGSFRRRRGTHVGKHQCPTGFAGPFGVRNEEDATGAGFLAAFGFLASRLLRF
ncbi:hypothetical protein ACFQU7_43515 [Pseudoroseomonas wenyumeiae]